MAINSTGRRVLVNKGIYDSTLQYYPMDAVYYEESYYICIKACVGIDPTDTNYWGYSHSIGDIGVSLGIRISDGTLYITDTVTTEDLGKVSILYRGEYSSTATYASLDVVTYEGSSYICIKDTTGNLPTDPTYFGLLCEGADGRGITSVTLLENKHLVIKYTDGTSTDIGEIIIKTPLDQIDAASISSDGHLILSRDDGTTLDAGYVRGPAGPTGPRGPKGEKGEDAPREAVLFVTQTLTTEQQTQARTNIGAASDEETTRLSEEIEEINGLLGSGEETVPTKQLFDKNNPNIAEVYLGSSNGLVILNLDHTTSRRSIFVPVDGRKSNAVTVHREVLTPRFVVATYTMESPQVNDLGVNVVSDSAATVKDFTVPIDATIKTIGIYYYNAALGDTIDRQQEMFDTLMMQYGSIYTGYEPYGTTSQPSIGVLAKIAETVAPVKRYGVKWHVDDVDDFGTRCFDAEGLSARIGVGATDGASDFDTIYPWSEMKRCNIRTNAAGANIVTYEGEDGFALDGSNGDVFVRIPRFCVEKYAKDGYEYRVVSRNAGHLHPAFVEGGRELDAIYIGAFEGRISDGKLRSIAGVIPTNNEEPPVFLTAAQANGTCYTLYDMRCIDALWTLMAVEYGCRNTNRIIGYGYADFHQPVVNECVSVVAETGVNRIVTNAISATKALTMPVGSNITVCKGAQETILTQAKLLSLVTENGQTVFTFDGDPIDTDTTCFIGSAPATTNFAETSDGALTWHTGRSEFVPGSVTKNPIRYRWIENPVGNIWHYTPDLTVKDLQMYLCQDMTKYGFCKTDDGYVPVCDTLPNTNRDNGIKDDVTGKNYWITSLQKDEFASGISFGKTYDKELVSTQAFGAYLYTDSGNGGLFTNVNGGGFDHLWRCNMLTNRAYTYINQKWYLYGARLIYKRII